MKDTSRSLCYPVYGVIVFYLVKQSAKPQGFLFYSKIILVLISTSKWNYGSFLLSFIHYFLTLSFCPSLLLSFIFPHSLTQTLSHPSIYSPTHPSAHPPTHPTIRSIVHSINHSYSLTHSLTHPPTDSFVSSLVRSFIQTPIKQSINYL